MKLGGSFKPYDAAVQGVLEAAWARDEGEAEVELRGQAYIIKLMGSAPRQMLKADPTKTRPVQRSVRPAPPAPYNAPPPNSFLGRLAP